MSIRVLVVDDSAFMRRVISESIKSEPDMELAGTAINGLDGLLKVEQLQPDVVTMDVEMPELDGLTALRHIMARYPRPVVMLSSVTHAGAEATIRALSIGAVDFVGKPSGAISLDFDRVRDELLQKIRIAAKARVRRAAAAPVASLTEKAPIDKSPRQTECRRAYGFDRVVVIGASTGGPRALGTLVAGLPDDGHTAYLIVQHMPAGFTRSLADRLNTLSPLSVREAATGDSLAAGKALLAPGDYHLQLGSTGLVELDQGRKVNGVRPSVDVTMASAVARFGGRVMGVILTGMGHDGSDGATEVHTAGGQVLAEDESTCVVWGMPRAVVERGVVNRVVPLDRMAEAIVDALGRGTHSVVAA